MGFNLMNLTMTQIFSLETSQVSLAGQNQSGDGEVSVSFLETMHRLLGSKQLNNSGFLESGEKPMDDLDSIDVLKAHMKKSLLKDMMDAKGAGFLDKLQQYLNVAGYDLQHSTVEGGGLKALEDMLVKAGFSRDDIQGLVEDLMAESGEDNVVVSDLMEGLFALEPTTLDDGSNLEIEDSYGENFLDTSAIPFVSSLFDLLGVPKDIYVTIISNAERNGKGLYLDDLIESLQELQEKAFFSGNSFEMDAANENLITVLEHLGFKNTGDLEETFNLGDFVSALQKIKNQSLMNDVSENENIFVLMEDATDKDAISNIYNATDTDESFTDFQALIEEINTSISTFLPDESVDEVKKKSSYDSDFLQMVQNFINHSEALFSSNGENERAVNEQNIASNDILNALEKLIAKIDVNEASTIETTTELKQDDSEMNDLLRNLIARIKEGSRDTLVTEVDKSQNTEVVEENEDDAENLLNRFLDNLKYGENDTGLGEKTSINNKFVQSSSALHQERDKTLMDILQFQGFVAAKDEYISTSELSLNQEFTQMAKRMELLISFKDNTFKSLNNLESGVISAFARSNKKEMGSLLDTSTFNNASNFGSGMKENTMVSGNSKASTLPSYVTLQVGKSILRAIKRGDGELKLQLKPVELGRLTMTIDTHGDSLKVSVMTENQAVKDILLSHANELKSTLAANGITIESFDVETRGNFEESLANSGQSSDGFRFEKRNVSKNNSFMASEEIAMDREMIFNTSGALHLVA